MIEDMLIYISISKKGYDENDGYNICHFTFGY